MKFKVGVTEGWEERWAKAMQKIFDRAFEVTTDRTEDGKFRIIATERDSGGPLMTVGDLACYLQVNRSVVRQMCKNRAQRGPHPLPFVKVNGKMIRFDRTKVIRWLETTPVKRRITPKKRTPK